MMAGETTAQGSDKSLMRPEHAEIFARGLYYLANTDGIDDREMELIRGFLDEVGRSDLLGSLPESTFDPMEAAEVLETSFLRRIFLRTAIALVEVDGKISEEEREAIRATAIAFGQEQALDELMREAESMSLE